MDLNLQNKKENSTKLCRVTKRDIHLEDIEIKEYLGKIKQTNSA